MMNEVVQKEVQKVLLEEDPQHHDEGTTVLIIVF